MRKSMRIGNISAMKLSKGKPDAVLRGNRRKMPSEALSVGKAEARRSGSIGNSLAVGRATGGHGKFHEKFAYGGHAVDMGFEKKGERLKIARKRAGILEEPAFKKGGIVHQGMKVLYKALHGHFENEPYMKKLKVTKADVYQGEPHRAKRNQMLKKIYR